MIDPKSLRLLLRHICIAGSFFLLSLPALLAQDPQLAQQYMLSGEYEKAASLFERLYQQSPNPYYLEKYVECLVSLDQLPTAEAAVRREIKRTPENIELYVTLGGILEKEDNKSEADKAYDAAVNAMRKDQYSIQKLGNAFSTLGKTDQAIAVYEKGEQLFPDGHLFSINLAELYKAKGDVSKMIGAYLNLLMVRPDNMTYVKTVLAKGLSESEYEELQKQLYARIQADQNSDVFPELLGWLFIQRKDYKNALRQLRAVDRRNQEEGLRVFGLAQVAYSDKDYETALEAYDYIVTEKGKGASLYLDAKKAILKVRLEQITGDLVYTPEELLTVEADYESLINDLGRNNRSAPFILEQADLEGRYLNNIPKGIQLLEDLLKIGGLSPELQGRAKLMLGDYQLIQGEIWEATLLYSQVDKAFNEELLGQEARFRNAKLAYYDGDFEWAQAQFDILKSSTSKLISNDAIDQSVFIMENMGLDTTDRPLQMYADAELLVFQNKYPEAFIKLDSIRTLFPKHTLEDDILYLEARTYVQLREYDKAEIAYTKVFTDFKEDIRADNALFELADLYEHQLQQPTKAQALYEKLFLDFNNSTLAVEARKRFRMLRGDSIQ